MYTLITPIFTRIFFLASAINNKLSILWALGRFWYFFFIGWLRWMNSEIRLSRPPFPKQSNFDIVSTLWCQIFSIIYITEGDVQRYKQENIVVDTVSMNIFPLWVIYFHVDWRTKSECKNIFIEMLTNLKIIHNELVLWALTFLMDSGTIATEMPNWPMLFFKI